MSTHIADPKAPRPRPHHYMNADGFCHAGDMFEAGTEHVVLYTAEELVRIVNSEKAEAWDQGATKASPYGGGYLRSLLIENPYRGTDRPATTNEQGAEA